MILASIFQDGVVLQRDMDIPVWGKCAAGEVVTSELDGISVKTKSSTNGEFILYFPAHDAGGPFELTVSTAGSGEKVILRDILIGEVWLASGQSNMEYKLYGEKKLIEKAERIRKNALALSFDGEVFCDNAVRSGDKLERTKNSSEACQYYALLFGDIDIDAPEYKFLKKHILDGFCTFAQNTQGREFVPVNAFIGRYLRIMALQKMSEKAILLENIASFFGGMVSSTGTLWEYKQKKGSYDHGFASYAAVALAECIADDNL